MTRGDEGEEYEAEEIATGFALATTSSDCRLQLITPLACLRLSFGGQAPLILKGEPVMTNDKAQRKIKDQKSKCKNVARGFSLVRRWGHTTLKGRTTVPLGNQALRLPHPSTEGLAMTIRSMGGRTIPGHSERASAMEKPTGDDLRHQTAIFWSSILRVSTAIARAEMTFPDAAS
jgi:hypothetical protein